MKICFVIGSLSGGGAERVVARISSQMSKMGHRVSILMIAQNKQEYEVDLGVKVYYVSPYINIRGIRYYSRAIHLRRLINHINPDVVLSFTAGVNIFSLLALKGTNRKIILSERNNPYTDPANVKERIRRDKSYVTADGFVFQTDDARQYFSKEIQNRSTIIINPIDSSIPQRYVGRRDKVVVNIGRLVPQKNHALLINAFANFVKICPQYKLHIYGEGPLRPVLQKQIDELNLSDKVILKGHNKEVLTEIIKSSMFVLSSDYEGISNALLEALAIGLPVISTNHPIGGAKLLIQDEVNGFLTEVGNIEQMSSAMLKIASNEDLSNKLSENASKIRELYSIDLIAKEWVSFCEKVVYNK